MLAMVVNDDAGHLTPSGILRFFREHARSYRGGGAVLTHFPKAGNLRTKECICHSTNKPG